MNREALVLRNRLMTEAFHRLPFRHHIRGLMLETVAHLPIPTRKPSTSIERILLIRPDHLGDVLLTTPALYALRTARPNAEIHMLIGPWSAGVMANYPEIDFVLTLAFPGFSRTPKIGLRSPYQQAIESAHQLRQIGYNSAVILRPDHWWGAMLAKFAGIPERIGYAMPQVASFLTETVEPKHQHAVLQNLRLVEKWTGPVLPENAIFQFPVDSFDQAYINGYLEEWGIRQNEPIVCIHPGTGTWVKHWEERKWAAVADELSGQLGAQIIFTGGDHELPLVRRIANYMKSRPCIIAGDTAVGQLAALFSRAQVVLGPDSGPLHLAAAVGAPTVALFGPADPIEFGTWGDPQKHLMLTTDIGCRPCRVLDWGKDDPEFHPCVREITVARLLDAARRAANHSR